MKRYNYVILFGLLLSATLGAQDQSQAIRFSQYFPEGTARYSAMGGAFGAIGADFSAASQNPAGLGLFRSSEFTITPVYSMNSSSSNYLENISRDNTGGMRISSLGMVNTYQTGRESGLVSTTLAFGYNTLNSYNNSITIQGTQPYSAEGSSLLDNFAWYANNNNVLDGFYEELAFQTAIMPYDSTISEYWHYLEPFDAGNYDGYGQLQTRVIERSGYTGEYAFSAAANIDNKLYLGGTLGIHAVRYYENIYHEESDVADYEPYFDSFRFDEYNSTRGYGFALKLGMLFKPIHILRIGATFQAPVVYHLTDDKFTELSTYWNSNSGLTDGYASSGLYSKEYILRTPLRASISSALLLGKLGLISMEYEFVDYSSADLDSPGYKFIDENAAIANDFEKGHNVKAGAELRLNPIYLRGGIQYYSNPFVNKENGSDILVYSAGIGFRINQTSIDIAYAIKSGKELYGLYSVNPASGEFESASITNKTSNLIVSLGYKF